MCWWRPQAGGKITRRGPQGMIASLTAEGRTVVDRCLISLASSQQLVLRLAAALAKILTRHASKVGSYRIWAGFSMGAAAGWRASLYS